MFTSVINQHQFYQDLINASKDALFMCDQEGELIVYNLAFAELLGISHNEISKININDYIMFGPSEKTMFLSRLVLVGSIEDFEVEIDGKPKGLRHCLLSAKRINYPNFKGYRGVIEDITTIKRQAKITKEKDLARQAEKMKEQFLANVSHEMRTPMNAILGMSNLALETDLNEEQYNYISSIKHSSEILLGVVNDILQISEIQNKSILFENKQFDLYVLLNNLMNVMQYKVKEKDLFLELVLAEDTPKVIRGDKLRLNQILYNLVGNAIKFTDKGLVKIHVFPLNSNQYSTQIKFIIEDTGIGIPENKIEAVFESFTRVKTKERLFEGTGLGLPIAKSLVVQQGGKMGLESQLGKGTNFFFDLIFEIGDELEKQYQASPKQEADINTSFRLLLVEDNKMNQLVAKKTLEKQWKNINISVANDGKEAIALLRKETFQIILMDIQMPIMDGYETTKYIREKMTPAIAALPILVMTAHAHISQNDKFKEHGWNDFILKPFHPKDLFKKIEEYAFLRL